LRCFSQLLHFIYYIADKLGPQTKAYQDLAAVEPKKDAKKPNYADVGALGGGSSAKPAQKTKKQESQSEEGAMPVVKKGKEQVLAYDDKDTDARGGGNYNSIPGGSGGHKATDALGDGHYDKLFAAGLPSGGIGNGIKFTANDSKKK
jgi:hypothetical protein